MNVKQLFTDKKAVSPVIGVILMVAITVILAAVIGTFVLGLGENVQQTTPQASFSFDYQNSTTNGDKLTVTHSGGDTVSASEIYFSSTGALDVDYSGTSSSISIPDSKVQWSELVAVTEVSAGNSIELNGTSNSYSTTNKLKLDQATVRVSWQSTNGDSSATLGTWEGPNA